MRQQLVDVTSSVRRLPGGRIAAEGFAEREAAKAMINDARQAADNAQAQITLVAEKGYDAKEFIDALEEMNVI